jgi:hypothetical protein
MQCLYDRIEDLKEKKLEIKDVIKCKSSPFAARMTESKKKIRAIKLKIKNERKRKKTHLPKSVRCLYD